MSNGYSSYATTQNQGESVRESEARALLRCASRLETVQQEGADYAEYCDALRQNQRLWTLFQAALTEPGNPLPADLRQTLLGLSLYIDRRTLRAIGEFSGKLLDVLININREIAAGLAARSGEDISDATGEAPAANVAPASVNLAG